jgi:ATP-binding cassette subfamily C protein
VRGAYVPLLALLAATPWLLDEGRLTVGQVVGGVLYLATGLEPAIQLLGNAAGTVVVSLDADPPYPAGGPREARPAGRDISADRHHLPLLAARRAGHLGPLAAPARGLAL